jgi:hypothetical protein
LQWVVLLHLAQLLLRGLLWLDWSGMLLRLLGLSSQVLLQEVLWAGQQQVGSGLQWLVGWWALQ